jgi:hypothetical protein
MGKRKEGLFGTLLVGLMAVGFVGTAMPVGIVNTTTSSRMGQGGTILRPRWVAARRHIPGAINLGAGRPDLSDFPSRNIWATPGSPEGIIVYRDTGASILIPDTRGRRPGSTWAGSTTGRRPSTRSRPT